TRSASLLPYTTLFRSRPWQERWGATEEEARRPLPGDELLHDADDQVTRAITIQAPAEEVWRWLVQIGADRGGFYSYDVLENLFRSEEHTSELQSRENL